MTMQENKNKSQLCSFSEANSDWSPSLGFDTYALELVFVFLVSADAMDEDTVSL